MSNRETTPCPDCQGTGVRAYEPAGNGLWWNGECCRCDGRGKVTIPGRSLADMLRVGGTPQDGNARESRPVAAQRPKW